MTCNARAKEMVRGVPGIMLTDFFYFQIRRSIVSLLKHWQKSLSTISSYLIQEEE